MVVAAVVIVSYDGQPGLSGPAARTSAAGNSVPATSAAAGAAAGARAPGATASPAATAGPTRTAPTGTAPTGVAPTGVALSGATPTRLVVPDLIATAPGGVTAADLVRIKQLSGVRAVLAIDGGQIRVNGARLTVLAAPAAALRPWMPPATAASAAVWSRFQAGQLITTAAAAAKARLTADGQYPAAAAVRARIADGGAALLGVTGVDGVVSQAEGARLGLVRNVAVLVNAPAADMTALARQVQAALGAGARVVVLVPAAAPARLPVAAVPTGGRPTSYLELFKESAARYCPGLSWTVLAAIGQIESADGQNMGPSTAGALGPMQFLPSTWAVWGTDGFGETGPPDIMNPFDAVPSAARLLCADGAVAGGTGLRRAIFGYNHADWYVDEVLALAAEYAREFR